MTALVLAGALALALAVIVVLGVALRRTTVLAGANERLLERARAEIADAVAQETAAQAEEVRRVLALERAETLSAIAAQERQLVEERRAEVEARTRSVAEELQQAHLEIERRFDERMQAFAADLERAQRQLELQLARLEQRQREAIGVVEARIEAESSELGTTADEQRRAITRLREEIEQAASAAVTEALDELESHTLERRRAIEDISERLRAREAAIQEGIERAETDVRAQLEVALVEFERRQLERLERVSEREIERHAQLAAMAFDERMREIREEAAKRLARELERAVELHSREELARRLGEPS